MEMQVARSHQLMHLSAPGDWLVQQSRREHRIEGSADAVEQR
jgi:hypothetical protein